MKIQVSHVVGFVNVEDVKAGWEIRHKQAWRRVTLSQSRSATRPNGWSLYVAGRGTPLHFIQPSTILVMAPVEGVEPHPFLPQVPTIKQNDIELPKLAEEGKGS